MEGPSVLPSNSHTSKESINVNLEDIGSDTVGNTDSSPVAKVDNRTKQHMKFCNLPKLPTGLISSSPVSGEKSTRCQKM